MRILALDLGTRTGWAGNAEGQFIYYGSTSFKPGRGDSPGVRFLRFEAWLRGCLKDHGIELVVYERPHMRGGHATDVLVGLQAILQKVCAEAGIEHQAVHSGTVKKVMAGSGRATKDMAFKTARDLWKDMEIHNDDEADALLVLAYALKTYGEKE